MERQPTSINLVTTDLHMPPKLQVRVVSGKFKQGDILKIRYPDGTIASVAIDHLTDEWTTIQEMVAMPSTAFKVGFPLPDGDGEGYGPDKIGGHFPVTKEYQEAEDRYNLGTGL